MLYLLMLAHRTSSGSGAKVGLLQEQQRQRSLLSPMATALASEWLEKVLGAAGMVRKGSTHRKVTAGGLSRMDILI